MPVLGKKKKRKDKEVEKQIAVVDQEEKLQEEVTALRAGRKDKALDDVEREVEAKVEEAARHSIQEVKMLEQGRCPSCGNRLEQFLYTSICTICGYSRRLSPEIGKVIVHLKQGSKIECDKMFEIRNNIQLCVKHDVVIARVSDDAVSFVEYRWTPEELREIHDRRERERLIPCDWCGRSSTPGSEDATEICIAIGADQHRYLFCDEKCLASFRKQYPARVHRDCYERECDECEECNKRY